MREAGGLFQHGADEIAVDTRIEPTVDRAADIGDAVRKAIAANKPYLIDVDIAADVNPAGAGVWELPGLGQSKAGIGTRFQPV